MLICLLGLLMGALHTWAAVTRYSMNADGISYLDIGYAYLRGDWQNAINPVWSPMYSWILGIVMRLFQPTMRWEFPLVQIVNFCIYIIAFASFAIFWRQAWIYLQRLSASEKNQAIVTLPKWAFLVLGYLLFIWSSLTMIEVWSVTPDMLMAAIVLLAATLILRGQMQTLGYGSFALLGFLLGLGYLTKSIMLPGSILFLVISLFSKGGLRHTVPRSILALVVFLIITGPFIALISQTKDRFTYGESGSLTYLRYVNGIPYPHWQGEPPEHGTPIHHSRKIFTDPPIYEFATPIGGTYPITYDPSYWYEGAKLNYSLGEILPAVLSNGLVYFHLFFRQLGPVTAGILILYLVGFQRSSPPFRRLGNWSLVAICILMLILYALVYVEGRYIAVFVVLLFTIMLANLSLPDTQANRKLVLIACLVMAAYLFGSLIAYNVEGVISLTPEPSPSAAEQSTPSPSWPGEVAEELHRLGIDSGSQVGVIGYAFDSYWARLARVKIVAEMFGWEADPFYLGSKSFQSQVMQVFENAGASAIVAEHVPDYANLDGWHRVGNTDYYIYQVGE